MKRIVIADIKSNNTGGKCTGHYFSVATNYLQIFNNLYDIKVAGGPIYANKYDVENLLQLPYDVNSTDNFVLKKLKTLLNARSLFRKADNQIIILQQSTATTSFVGIWLFASAKIDLYMIQYDLSGLRGHLHRILYRLAKPKIKGVICPNNDVGQGYGLPYLVVPDYLYITSWQDTHFIPYAKKTYDFCILGILNEDKGVIPIAKKIANTKYRILIAGFPQGGAAFVDQLTTICDSCSNIELYLDYLSEEQYIEYMNQSRYSLLNYHGDYTVRSSGVVFDFIFNGVPVIAHKCQAMSFIEKYNMGYCYDNIESIDLSLFLNESIYLQYIENINLYKKKFDTYKKQLITFITK